MAESDEELLTLDVSDDAQERAAPVVGGQATVTWAYGTAIVGNCAWVQRTFPPCLSREFRLAVARRFSVFTWPLNRINWI